MTKVYYETKEKLKRISEIPFDQETWNWYLEEGLNKKLEQLEPLEREFIKQHAHSKRAISILRSKNRG